MKYETLIKKLDSIKAGVFTNLTYKTEVPLRAEYKKAGYKIIKTTTMNTRFKVKYANIKGVELKPSTKKSPYTSIIPNLISECISNGNKYLTTYPFANSNPKSTFKVITPEGKTVNFNDSYKDMILPSYFSKSSSTKIMKINVENIIKVGK